MILRRVIAHFRKQEWTAIFLDFVIVVAGILLAFQITEWSDGRADRARESQYLDELVLDLREDLKEIDFTRRAAEGRMSAMEKLFEFAGITPLRTVTLLDRAYAFAPVPPFGSDDPYALNGAISNRPLLNGSRHTYQALISTGDIGLIRDRVLRRRIQAYYAFLDEANGLEADLVDQFRSVNQSRHRLGVPIMGGATTDELAALVASDTQFAAELQSYWAFSAWQAKFADQVREDALALVDAIEGQTAK